MLSIQEKLIEFIQSQPDEHIENRYLALKPFFESDEAPSYKDVLQVLPKVKHPETVPYLTSLFETYLPSYKQIPAEKRDLQYRYIQRLPESLRQNDYEFLNKLFIWVLSIHEKGKLNEGMFGFDVIFRLIERYSGVFPTEYFERALVEFEDVYETLDFDELATYSSDEDSIYPVKDMIRFLKLGFICAGAKNIAALLVSLEAENADPGTIDIELIWLKISEYISGCHSRNAFTVFLRLMKLIEDLEVQKDDFKLTLTFY